MIETTSSERKPIVSRSDPQRRAQSRASVWTDDDGRERCTLSLPDIRCGACVAKLERFLNARSDVLAARVNLTLHQANITFAAPDTDPTPVIDALADIGYAAAPIQADSNPKTDTTGGGLLRAIAVAGFGAMNIMLLSVSVWAGAEGQTRETFHLVSALIALPVVLYAGQPFFRSAFSALRLGQTNMDVPITLGVLLALALSVFETFQGGDHVFFDAAVTLLFFLLTGRYLDHLMQERARSAVTGLIKLSPRGAMLRGENGALTYVVLRDIAPGSVLSIAPDEHVPLDVEILTGSSDLDRSLVTGEAMTVAVGPGDTLEAGTLNLTGVIEAKVLRSSDDSFLSQMIRMQSNAEAGRGAYVRIADRAARLYAPVVHSMALATFVGWMVVTGGDWQTSLFVAISVLIITCPCALGLAVPVAHVVAAGRLMRSGILMKDGAALERMAQIDCAVFDKTGTLTTGTPRIGNIPEDLRMLAGASALARKSIHPAARAIATGLRDTSAKVTEDREIPGYGIKGMVDGRNARLGRAKWVAEIAEVPKGAASPTFAYEGETSVSFDLMETLRGGAEDAVSDLLKAGLPVTLLSGDMAERARLVASTLGIRDVHHGATPSDKITLLESLRQEGHFPLMVGDGLNDAAALAAAHVSMAPSSASDAGRTAADFIFLRDSLDAVPATWRIASQTARIVRQNFALAVGYNCIAIPLAVAGLVTPLIAALAMSGSSILVIANALRLNRAGASIKSDPRPSLECREILS